MYITLILISFFSSVGITLLLRRLDKERNDPRQIQRMGELHLKTLEDSAKRFTREIRDATLEFEVAVRQSRSLQNDLRNALNEFDVRLKKIEADREIIDSIASEISGIAENAEHVSRQVERLDLGLQRISMASGEIESLKERIEHLDEIVAVKGEEAESRLSGIIQKLIAETDERTRNLTEQIRSSFQIMKNDFAVMEEKIESRAKEADFLGERIQSLHVKMQERWDQETGRFEMRSQELEEKLRERLAVMEEGLQAVRNNALEGIRQQAEKIRSQLDEFSLSMISKRDEILNETHRMADKMSRQIESFQEKYIQVENRIMAVAEESRAYLEEAVSEFENSRLSKISSRISALEDEVSELRNQRIAHLDEEAARLKDDLKKYSSDLSARLEQDLLTAKESLRSLHREEEKNLQAARDELEQIRETLDIIAGDIKASLRSETDHSISLIKEARKAEEEHFVRVRDDMNRIREELRDRLETLENQLREAGKFRSRVDEYIREAAQAVENAGSQVISRLEQQTKANAVKYMEALQSQLTQARSEFQKLRTEIAQEAAAARELRDRLGADMSEDRARLEKFMERLSVIEKAEELTEQLDATVETLSEKLREARAENAKMHELVRGIETIRETRKELESELRLLEAQRERIAQAEDHFHDIDRQLTGLGEKFALLARGEEIAEELENRTEQLVALRDEFEKFYGSMNEKRKFMESALRSIEKSKEETKNAMEAAAKLLSKVERAEHRQEDITKFLTALENKAAMLRKMESDIQQVEARFEQMEGLFEDLNSRTSQISAMAKKVEEIRSSGEHIKSELESVIHEADEKMDRLSAFYQTIEKMLDDRQSEPAEKIRAAAMALPDKKGKASQSAGSIPDWKKEGIISLHLKHKWDADLIAEKIKLDPAVVKAVIANHMASSR